MPPTCGSARYATGRSAYDAAAAVSVFHRGEPPPGPVRAALGGGQRLLAHAHLVVGGWALAGNAHLVLVDDEAAAELSVDSIAWSEIATAGLEGEAGVLSVELVDGSRRVLVLGRGQGQRLARVLRERIQHSVLLSRTVDLGGRRTVRVAARRGADGVPFIQVVPGARVDLRGPEAAAAVAEAEAAVRDQVGLPPAGR